MKARTTRQPIAVFMVAALCLMLPGALAAEGPALRVTLGPESALWLEGKSNIHDFVSRTSSLTVTMTRDTNSVTPTTPEELAAFLRASGVRTLDVSVPVTSLHSKKEGLDKNLWKDLRSDKHPEVTFHLTSYTVASGATDDTLQIEAEGTLTVAGLEQPVSLTMRAYRAEQGLWLEGNEPLRMKEFGIKPRTMMLGTLRVKDQIVVGWRLLLVPGGN